MLSPLHHIIIYAIIITLITLRRIIIDIIAIILPILPYIIRAPALLLHTRHYAMPLRCHWLTLRDAAIIDAAAFTRHFIFAILLRAMPYAITRDYCMPLRDIFHYYYAIIAAAIFHYYFRRIHYAMLHCLLWHYEHYLLLLLHTSGVIDHYDMPHWFAISPLRHWHYSELWPLLLLLLRHYYYYFHYAIDIIIFIAPLLLCCHIISFIDMTFMMAIDYFTLFSPLSHYDYYYYYYAALLRDIWSDHTAFDYFFHYLTL